jgi:hypothetical protein
MSGDRGQPYVSVLANMNDEDYRKKMAQQQALENVYPEAVVAPLARSAGQAVKAAVMPERAVIVAPPIGSNLPSKDFLEGLARTPRIQEILLQKARDKYIESGKRAMGRELEDSTASALKQSSGEFVAFANEEHNKNQKKLKQRELLEKELRERKYGTN